MNPKKALGEHMEVMSELCRRYGAVRLCVFGSALREDWDPNHSDLDFVADFGPPPEGTSRLDQLLGLQAELERLFGRPVDLVETDQLKWVIRDRVLAEAQIVYAA